MVALDTLQPYLDNLMHRKFKKFTADPNPAYDWAHEDAIGIHDADVIISAVDMTVLGHKESAHAPVIDVDIPMRYYPSSTEGHGHLYIDKYITWREYKRLLRALVRAGIVEKGYYNACVDRGYTSVRLPWIKKNS